MFLRLGGPLEPFWMPMSTDTPAMAAVACHNNTLVPTSFAEVVEVVAVRVQVREREDREQTRAIVAANYHVTQPDHT